MPTVVADCLSGDCAGELNSILAPGLNTHWPAARTSVESALKVLLSSIGNDNVWVVPSGTLPKDFRAMLWPTGLPDTTRFPMLIVVEGANIWQAPNNAAYDLGTVPATGGTGTKFRNIYTDVDAQIASAVPYTPSGAYAGLWPVAPTNVQEGLDSIAQTFSAVSALPKAQVFGSSGAGAVTYTAQNKATFLSSVQFDPLSMWSAVNNQFTIPASQGGYYLITFSGSVTPNIANNNSTPVIWVRKNSESIGTYTQFYYTWTPWAELSGVTGTYTNFANIAFIRQLSAGDTISLWHFVNGNIQMTAINWALSLVKLN